MGLQESKKARAGIEYEDFALRLMPDGRGGHMVVVQHATGGGGSAPFEPSLSVDELEAWMETLEARLRGSDGSEMQPEIVGAELFRNLLRDRVRDSFLRSSAHQERDDATGLRLRLVFNLEDEGVAPLAALPWELLHDPEQRKFLARDRYTPVVRCLDVHHSELPLAAEPPLNVLLIGAAPRDQLPPKLDDERQAIQQALEDHAELKIEIVPDGRLETLRKCLAEHQPHVLHFMGHGQFDRATGDGALIFQDARRRSRLVPGATLAETLRNFRSVRLVVLSACETAAFPRRDGIDPHTGVATALVRDGVPAVVAMQVPIRAGAARIFAQAFYQALAREAAVDTAVSEARLALAQDRPKSLEWAVPTLHLRSSQGRVLDRIVEKNAPSDTIRTVLQSYQHQEFEHHAKRNHGFVGRGFVFDKIDKFLDGGTSGYFTVEGEAGIGKSALVAELIRRRKWIHHFNNQAAGVRGHEPFLSHVCAQLIARHHLDHSSLPPETTRDPGFLVSLLREASRKASSKEPLVILIDALDEADPQTVPAGTNLLHLPPELPSGVFMVLTTRPLNPEFQPFFTDAHKGFTLDADSSENRADIREYLGDRLPRPGIVQYRKTQGISASDLIDLLDAKSEGNFMYLHHVLRELERGTYDSLSFEELPSGLKAYYEHQWQRMRGDDPKEIWLDYKLPVLAALTQVPKPAVAQVLADLSGVDQLRWVRETLKEWRPFLDVSEVEDPEGKRHTVYSLYHKSFYDFMTEKEEIADVFWDEERRVIQGTERRLLDELS